MKPPVSLKQDLLRCDTCVLIDSATTLCFASCLSLTKMVLLEIVFEVQNSLFIMLLNNNMCNAFFLAAVSPTINSFSEKTFVGL